ncbi:S1/P1 nuclease [Sphingomonas canadensis]|uniref:S1/P1 nuclease n=1 Tax=Sphingomonas canadensis TaxID=1219257 RepID=A0ABW3H577_9SPHN|nr:S1/P1 nuclease [Sphingomonas canadensis]MCW3836624.1 S1/P1 nuclease [Sphingomonas canadensis]
MKRLVAMVAMIAGLCAAAPAHAWWDYGHETVAAIAQRNIAPATRRAVDRLLARSALMGTPQCPARTMAEASRWADCVKKREPRYLHPDAWHFQDVDICRPFDLAAPCADGNCVSARIARDMATLKDRHAPLRARVEALLFLIHLTADLHQPLHAGDDHDRGGFTLPAFYGGGDGPRTNLHFVWDGLLAERAISTPPGLVRRYPAARRRAIQAGTLADWSRESWAAARDLAYAGAKGGDPCGPDPQTVRVGEAEIRRLIPPVRTLVVHAGLRLARLLDEALGGRG